MIGKQVWAQHQELPFKVRVAQEGNGSSPCTPELAAATEHQGTQGLGYDRAPSAKVMAPLGDAGKAQANLGTSKNTAGGEVLSIRTPRPDDFQTEAFFFFFNPDDPFPVHFTWELPGMS